MMEGRVSIGVADGGNIRIHIPMKLKRKSGRKVVIAPESLDGALEGTCGMVQHPIVEAIAKAHSWVEMLEGGEVENVTELAKELKLCRPYVMRILSLVNLAPEIVEAIFKGKEPDGLSLDKLVKGFPDDWEEQREIFGFQKEAQMS